MFVIGITTFNRKKILERMAQSLKCAENKTLYEICIYDDASEEFDGEYLHHLFPRARKVIVNSVNLGADVNTYQMYKDFLDNYSENDFLFNGDSDLIYSDNWIDCALDLITQTDGVLSLFNTTNHTIEKDYSNELCTKKTMGAAGTVFRYDVLKEIFLNKQYNSDYVKQYGVDYGWNEVVSRCGKKLYCVRNSLVQHIGLNGYNSDVSRFDFGINFKVDSLINGQILNDVIFDELLVKPKPTYFQMFPFSVIPYGSRVIIYGSGKTASDYLTQIKRTNYCKVVAIVDKKYESNENEFYITPKRIVRVQYDYIIIASIIESVIEKIILELKSCGVYDDKKIVIVERNIIDVTKIDQAVEMREI